MAIDKQKQKDQRANQGPAQDSREPPPPSTSIKPETLIVITGVPFDFNYADQNIAIIRKLISDSKEESGSKGAGEPGELGIRRNEK